MWANEVRKDFEKLIVDEAESLSSMINVYNKFSGFLLVPYWSIETNKVELLIKNKEETK